MSIRWRATCFSSGARSGGPSCAPVSSARFEHAGRFLNGDVNYECITIEGDTNPLRAERGGRTPGHVRLLSPKRGDRFVRCSRRRPEGRRMTAAAATKARWRAIAISPEQSERYAPGLVLRAVQAQLDPLMRSVALSIADDDEDLASDLLQEHGSGCGSWIPRA